MLTTEGRFLFFRALLVNRADCVSSAFDFRRSSRMPSALRLSSRRSIVKQTSYYITMSKNLYLENVRLKLICISI